MNHISIQSKVLFTSHVIIVFSTWLENVCIIWPKILEDTNNFVDNNWKLNLI